MARLTMLDAAGSIQVWLGNGGIIAISLGVLLAAGLVRRAGISSAWVWLSYLLVIASVLTIVLGELHAYPYDLWVLIVLSAVLIPAWALWLAIEVPNLTPPHESAEDEPAPPPEHLHVADA